MPWRSGYLIVLVGLFLAAASCAEGFGGASSGGMSTGFGGAQDAGYFREKLEAGLVPEEDDITYEGFLAEHGFPLPDPECGDLLCAHGIIGVGASVEPGHLTLLQVGLNSAEDPEKYAPAFRNLALVIDKSGSMGGGSKMAYVKDGLLKLVDQLEPEDVVALVVYDSGARVLRPASPLTDPAALKEQIAGIYAGGSTNLHAGMILGYEEARKHYDPQAANRVVLLTDGQANTGVTDPDQIVSDSKAYNDEGIGISTIGVGLYYNQDLMLRLAENGGGNNYFIDDPARAEQVFIDELYSLYTELARDLHIEVTPGAAFDTVGVYGAGSSVLQPDGSVVIDVPSVFVTARQGVLLVALEPTGRGPGPHPLAEIRYEYVRHDTGALEGGVVAPTYPGKLPYEPGDEHYGGAPARKAIVVLEIVRSFKKASALYHDPQAGWADAVATLQALQAYVNTHQNALRDPEIDEDLLLIEKFIDNATP